MPKGVMILNFDDPAAVHNALAEVFGEPKLEAKMDYAKIADLSHSVHMQVLPNFGAYSPQLINGDLTQLFNEMGGVVDSPYGSTENTPPLPVLTTYNMQVYYAAIWQSPELLANANKGMKDYANANIGQGFHVR